MENNNIMKSLDKAAAFVNKTKFEKLKAAPLKYIFWKFFEVILSSIKLPVKFNIKTFWNEQMIVIIPEKVSIYLYRYSFIEEGLTKIFLHCVKPGMVLFDVGSHFGYFSLLGSFLVGQKGRVHAFEPTPSTYEILKINTHHKGNITVNNCGASDKEKYVLLNDFGVEYSAFNSLYKAKIGEKTLRKIKPKQYKIKCISIDNYISTNNVIPDFIKIDAENSEYDILIGMDKTLKEIRPIITLEFGDFCDGLQDNKVFKYLTDRNYIPYEYKCGEIIEKNISLQYRFDNLLFLPN